MRHLKTYGIFEGSSVGLTLEQYLWLYKVCGVRGKINNQGFVDVSGSVDLKGNAGITPDGQNFHGIKFGKVDGHFNAAQSGLKHLNGCPREVGSFNINDNKEVKDLIGGPVKVGSGYSAANCGLVSLEGCPLTADSLDVEFNELKNLKGAEKSHIRLMMIGFNSINSLEGMPRELEEIKGTNNPVSEETLGKIISTMEANPNMGYGAILASLQSRISQEDWEKLDKSSLDKMNQTQKGVYGMLGGIGGI
jgi:hypothetical protein